MPKTQKEVTNINYKTAYAMTKLYCRSVVDDGRDIPTVSDIHKELGKGSIRDIAKALSDFKQEQVDFKKLIDELDFAQLPLAVTRLMKEQWLLTKEYINKEYSERLSESAKLISELTQENKKLKAEISLLKKGSE